MSSLLPHSGKHTRDLASLCGFPFLLSIPHSSVITSRSKVGNICTPYLKREGGWVSAVSMLAHFLLGTQRQEPAYRSGLSQSRPEGAGLECGGRGSEGHHRDLHRQCVTLAFPVILMA